MRKGVADYEGTPLDIMSGCSSERSSPRSSPNVTDDASVSRVHDMDSGSMPCQDLDLSKYADTYAAIDRTIERCVPEDFGEWKEIGYGNFATCYAVTTLRGFKECVEGTSVCLKVYKKQSEQAVHRELMALYRLSDPEEENCVVQLLGYNLTQTPYFLVMRPAGDVTLESEMKRHAAPLARDYMLRIAGNVLSALEYAHSWGVIHRDLKASNVLVTTLADDDTATDAPVARLIDWGESEDLMAREQHQGSAFTTDLTKDVGTWRWMSPATMSLPGLPNTPVRLNATDVDMYSYGALLYFMATNRVPFDKLTDVQVVFCVTRGMRPSFKEVPPDDEEQMTCLSDDDETHGDNAYKPSALLEFLIRSCFDTETPAPSYGFVRAILQAVGQGLGEREEEDCDDGLGLHELFRPPVPPEGAVFTALSKLKVGAYRALRATQEEGAAQEEGARMPCDDRVKEAKPPKFRTLRRRLSEIFTGPTDRLERTRSNQLAGDRTPTREDSTWRRMRRMSVDAHSIQMSRSFNPDSSEAGDSGYSVASFRSGHSRRRPSVTNLGKRLMNTFSKPPREYSTMSGSIGSSVGGSSIGSSSIGDSLGGGMVGGSYRGQAAQYPTPGARKVSIRRNSYIT